jgi:hypothetical protein
MTTSYVLTVRGARNTRWAKAAVTYPADVPSCIARAVADLQAAGIDTAGGRVLPESRALQEKQYKGRLHNCKEVTP